eukprot:4625344-Pleurochrysis_carterae.AAC.1
MRPNRGQNQARPRLLTTILPTRRGTSTTAPLPRCDRSLQSRSLRANWDGTYVYARLPKSAPHYPP